MGVTTLTAELFFPAAHALAESPLWSPETGELVYVDIGTGLVNRLDAAHPLAARSTGVGAWVGAVVPAGAGQVLALAEPGLVQVDLASGATALLQPPVGLAPAHRYNDAKLDRAGRLVASSIGLASPRGPTGALFTLAGAGSLPLAEGIRTPNAICFSPDGRWLYAADTAIGTLWRFAYESGSGTLGARADFAAPDIAPGRPDGATVDAEGGVWSARYNGGAVARITPDGRLDTLVTLPVRQVTSCAFGGPGLDLLFITTARQNLDAAALAHQPLAGSIFVVRPGVAGLAESKFAGAGLIRRAGQEQQ